MVYDVQAYTPNEIVTIYTLSVFQKQNVFLINVITLISTSYIG